MKNTTQKVLVVGCGNMGKSHALAYQNIKGFQICGLVSRGKSKELVNQYLKSNYPLFDSYEEALKKTKPNAVCIATYPDTHKEYTLKALENGCHVFLEKPLAVTVKESEELVEASKKYNKKLVVGYILRHHPSWQRFIKISQELGSPLVMRMNLNQQSKEDMWETHKNLMNSMSPIVDCGVHYVDVMCQMTRKKPIQVSAIGARLSDELKEGMYNYGQLQVKFEDGSVGWYEAGWGPMMSEVAFFVKDVVGPKGSVSIVADKAGSESQSDNVDAHTKTESLKRHFSELDKHNNFVKKDEIINLQDEPDHNELCKREQEFFYKAITEDLCLNDHLADAVNSLKIVLAADESIKTNKTIFLD